MMWIIELVQLLILAIDRKCILREVVGADAEEIDELCQSSQIITAAGVSIMMPAPESHTGFAPA